MAQITGNTSREVVTNFQKMANNLPKIETNLLKIVNSLSEIVPNFLKLWINIFKQMRIDRRLPKRGWNIGATRNLSKSASWHFLAIFWSLFSLRESRQKVSKILLTPFDDFKFSGLFHACQYLCRLPRQNAAKKAQKKTKSTSSFWRAPWRVGAPGLPSQSPSKMPLMSAFPRSTAGKPWPVADCVNSSLPCLPRNVRGCGGILLGDFREIGNFGKIQGNSVEFGFCMKLERNSGRQFWGWIFWGACIPGETRLTDSRENFAEKGAEKFVGNYPKIRQAQFPQAKSTPQNLGIIGLQARLLLPESKAMSWKLPDQKQQDK